MLKSLLLDLDGTLLPMETEKFVEHYMMALAPQVKDFMEPQLFLKMLMSSTYEMINNTDGSLTNEQVFTQHFLSTTGIIKEGIWPVFDRFYLEVFPALKKHVQPTELAKEIVTIAKAQGRKIAIATNPVFPKTAIYERLNWLGLSDFPFDFISYYENSHFCKPQIEYYQEIVTRLGLAPSEAIMIGNDMQEDMVASKLGIDTYLLNDFPIDRGEPKYLVKQQGSLQELKQQLMGKEGIFRE